MIQQNLKMWSNFVCPLGPFSLAQSHIIPFNTVYTYNVILYVSIVL